MGHPRLLEIAIKLRDGGFDAVTAGSGREALGFLDQEATIDAIVMDLRLGDMTGLEVLETLRHRPRWQATPVVLITVAVYAAATFPPQETYQALFTKPFPLVELRETLVALLKPSDSMQR